jgi:hypothetical protein
VDQKFKRIKGKLKYTITDTQHRHLFVNSLFPHLKYPLRQHKFQSQVEALQEALTVRGKPIQAYRSSCGRVKQDLKNLTFQLNQNKGKEKREDVWCTMCRTEGHHKNECPLFAQYIGVGMPNPLASGGPWCEI